MADWMKYPTILSILGNSFLLTSFLFIGPLNVFEDMVPSVNLSYGMAAMVGIGNGTVLVSSAARVYKVGHKSQSHQPLEINVSPLKTAMAKGFEDNINTYILITGLWNASFNFGSFVGPTLLGFVVEEVCFRKATVTFIPIFTLALLGNLAELANNVYKARSNKRQEYEEFK